MRLARTAAVLLVLALAGALLTGCGRGSGTTDDGKPDTATAPTPTTGAKGTEKAASTDLGFPTFATKNTTRIGGADPIADAAAAARAVYSGATRITRPRAVVLADAADWRIGLAASVLMSSPIRAPLLYAQGKDELPGATQNALTALAPTGSKEAGGAQVIRIGDVPELDGTKTTDLRGADAFAFARAIDAFQAAARGTTSDRVIVVGTDSPEYAMPAAAWAAKAGDPILFTERDSVPKDTRAAIAAHQQPKIYVLGPESAVSSKAVTQLKKLGSVTRISTAKTPAAASVAFARFVDGNFGWGVVDPGHGFVFANTKRPGDAGAAAPLSASGTYGPLLVTDDADTLPTALSGYLLDVQPGYTRDPVRGVYNHAWIIGDESALSVPVQSQIDSLLEIVPVNERASATSTP
jgi:hypothetical protein